MLHWDFHCANILVTADDRLGVLDFRLIDAPVYVDIARLMSDLQTYRLQALTYGLFMRPRSSRAFMPRSCAATSGMRRCTGSR